MLQRVLVEVKGMFRFIFPQGSGELIVFFLSFLLYLSMGVFLAGNSYMLDFPPYMMKDGSIETLLHLYDPYFSYDTNHYYHLGLQNIIGHPFVVVVTKPLLLLGDSLAQLIGIGKAKTFFLVFCTSCMISLSIVYVDRYLSRVVELEGFVKYLIVAFFAFFSTNLVLSFTFESFSISAFLLSLSCVYYSIIVKEKRKVSFFKQSMIAFLLGGVTITNFSKGIIPMFFVNKDWKNVMKRVVVLGIGFLVVSIFCVLISDSNPFTDLSYRLTTFSGGYGFRGNLLERLVDSFWGSPILLPTMWVGFFGFSDNLYHAIIELDFYHGWWQYVFVFTLGILVFLGFSRNYKNKYVVMLALLLSVDVVIHVLCQYGIKSLFLYGSHWVYIIPMVLGWLYKSLDRYQNMLKYTLVGLFIILIINNAVYMVEFFELALKIFGTPEWNV